MRAALALAACLLAGACAVPGGDGCDAYGRARVDMPPLADDRVGRWVARTDTIMTAVCRRA